MQIESDDSFEDILLVIRDQLCAGDGVLCMTSTAAKNMSLALLPVKSWSEVHYHPLRLQGEGFGVREVDCVWVCPPCIISF